MTALAVQDERRFYIDRIPASELSFVAPCTVDGCIRPMRRIRDGLCNLHRLRMDKHGTLDRIGKLEMAQYYAQVATQVQSSEALEDGECWEWAAGTTNRGYGVWHVGTQQLVATRVVHELVIGPLSLDDHVCHRCDNPPCYRPSHLFAGTRTENMRDAALKRRFNPRHGQRNTQAKVTDAQAEEIARLVQRGVSTSEVATQFGISRSQVWRISRGDRGKPSVLGRRRLTKPIPPEALRP